MGNKERFLRQGGHLPKPPIFRGPISVSEKWCSKKGPKMNIYTLFFLIRVIQYLKKENDKNKIYCDGPLNCTNLIVGIRLTFITSYFRCPNVFCKNCVKGNLGRGAVSDIVEAEDWHCFECKPKQIRKLRTMYFSIAQVI